MAYTLVIALQLFCLYHAYSRRVEFWWFVIIFIIPVLGCILYLYKHFYTPSNIDTIGGIAEEVRENIDTGYKSRKLQRQLDFSDTTENKLRLGQEYLNQGYYEDAFELFKSCNSGAFENDPEVLSKLVQSSFLLHDYEATIAYGEQPRFLNDIQVNDEKVNLAWAYYYNDRQKEAALLFESFDKSYGSYFQRHEYIRYLISTQNESKAHDRMSGLLKELSQMDRSERKLNAPEISSIKSTAKEMGL